MAEARWKPSKHQQPVLPEQIAETVFANQMAPHQPQDRDAEAAKVAQLRQLRLARLHQSTRSRQQCIDETDKRVAESLKLLTAHVRD